MDTTLRKSLLLFVVLGFMSIPLLAQNEMTVTSTISNVTVYQEGAEITHQASVNLPAGKTILLFKGLSSKIDPRSIHAKGSNDLMIVSVSHSLDYMNEAEASEEIRELDKQRLALRDSIALINAVKNVYLKEKEMILANKSIGGDNGVDVDELRNAATFFRARLTEIEHKLKELDKAKFNVNVEIIRLSNQLQEWSAKSTLPTSVVKVIVSTKQKQSNTIELKYTANDAGWEPTYDIRISDVDKPMALYYKAKVFQNTGEDWKNVKLILSTGNPSLSNNKPELGTYYLTFNNYYKNASANDYAYQQPTGGVVRGKVVEAETGEALPGVNVVVKGTTTGAVTDIDGNYEVKLPPGHATLVFSFIGLQTQEVNASPGSIRNVSLNADVEQLSEVVVTAYGVRGLAGSASGVQLRDKKTIIPLAIEKRQTSTEFEIKIPYTIPSDNQQYDVTMVEYQVPVEYSYSAVPKLSEDAYLTARIADWTKYEMVSGAANIFFQGIYQGETFLDLDALEDTLSISVGRDQDIVISRDIQQDFAKRSTVGTSVKEMKSWEITIKNNKEVAIDMVVEDQFPISKVSDIKVDEIESTGAEVNKDDGKLTWNLSFAPGEKKVLVVQYEVRYPKGRNLIVD